MLCISCTYVAILRLPSRMEALQRQELWTEMRPADVEVLTSLFSECALL